MSKLRAVVTVECYVYGETESELLASASMQAYTLNKKYDNDARVIEVGMQQIDEIEFTKIYPKE